MIVIWVSPDRANTHGDALRRIFLSARVGAWCLSNGDRSRDMETYAVGTESHPV